MMSISRFHNVMKLMIFPDDKCLHTDLVKSRDAIAFITRFGRKMFKFVRSKFSLSELSTTYRISMSSLSEFVFEGVLMFLVALIGVCLNISSVVYFAQLKTQSAFHRSLKESPFLASPFPPLFCRSE